MLRRFISRWVKGREGTTAVEFSFLIIPYVFLTLAIIELSVMYTAASLLEGATGAAARLIRTGQLQQVQTDPEQMFRDAICNYATVLIKCTDIFIEVIPLDNFSDYANY